MSSGKVGPAWSVVVCEAAVAEHDRLVAGEVGCGFGGPNRVCCNLHVIALHVTRPAAKPHGQDQGHSHGADSRQGLRFGGSQ